MDVDPVKDVLLVVVDLKHARDLGALLVPEDHHVLPEGPRRLPLPRLLLCWRSFIVSRLLLCAEVADAAAVEVHRLHVGDQSCGQPSPEFRSAVQDSPGSQRLEGDSGIHLRRREEGGVGVGTALVAEVAALQTGEALEEAVAPPDQLSFGEKNLLESFSVS